MKKTLYWIDDSHDKQKLPAGAVKKQLERGLKVILKPDSPLKKREEFDQLLSKIEAKSCYGVVMDYQLTQLGGGGTKAYGTTWAAEIRARYPSIPIIGTSHCSEKDIPKFQLRSFLSFFPRKQLMGTNPQIENLKALFDGYHDAYEVFKERKGKMGRALMVKLLAPPEEVMNLLLNAIPSTFLDKWDQETPHAVGRWIWHELQGRPGFLFDSLELATHLGLNADGVEKVCSKFQSARYIGAFASDDRPRWWIIKIRRIFENLINNGVVGALSNERDKLLKTLGVKESEIKNLLSRAYGHKGNEIIPNCVAYKDDGCEESQRVSALFEETRVDPRDLNPPFGFEVRRIFGSQNSK